MPSLHPYWAPATAEIRARERPCTVPPGAGKPGAGLYSAGGLKLAACGRGSGAPGDMAGKGGLGQVVLAQLAVQLGHCRPCRGVRGRPQRLCAPLACTPHTPFLYVLGIETADLVY